MNYEIARFCSLLYCAAVVATSSFNEERYTLKGVEILTKMTGEGQDVDKACFIRAVDEAELPSVNHRYKCGLNASERSFIVENFKRDKMKNFNAFSLGGVKYIISDLSYQHKKRRVVATSLGNGAIIMQNRGYYIVVAYCPSNGDLKTAETAMRYVAWLPFV